MSKSDAWMPLYIGDYLADTMHLTAEQHGAYLLLLMHQWRIGTLPNDDAQLAAIARVDPTAWKKRVGPVVRRFFEVTDAGLSQKRLAKERADATDITIKRAEAGRLGGAAKWNSKDHAQTRAKRLAAARLLGRHTQEEWERLVEFCGNKCARCGAEGVPLQKDHVKPIYQGGSDGIDNIQPLCRSCNSSKGPESKDWRPAGWQDAVKMPGKRLANAWQTPGHSQSQSQKASSSGIGSVAARPSFPSRGDPPEAWLKLADKAEIDENGRSRPVCGGMYLDVAAELVCEAAGISDPNWRGDWRPLIGWLRDDIDFHERILPAIRRVADRPGYQPPRSLSYFDRAVREQQAKAA